MEYHLIQYYCRKKFYHTSRLIAESALKSSPNNSVLKFQLCVLLILQDSIGEALRELESLTSKQDIELAVIIAMIHAQNLCEVPDGEAIITLENRLKNERKRASEVALFYAANFYLLMENYKCAREYMDMMFRLNPNSIKALLVKGWLELYDGKLTIAVDCFRTVLSSDSQNFDAAIGEVLSLSADEAITKLNQLIVKYPSLTPPLIEKMRLLMVNKDWEQAIDIAHRILSIDPQCIPAFQFKILHDIRMQGNYNNLAKQTNELLSMVSQQEYKNWSINYEFGLVLVRICGTNTDLIRQLMRFVESASRLVPNNVKVNMELAHQHYLAGDFSKAADLYKKVARLDDTATEALIGLIKCRMAEGDFNEEIKQQINFLTEIYNSDLNSDLLMLLANNEDVKTSQKLMIQAINLRFEKAERLQFGLQYLIELDATFILQVLKKLPFSVNSKRFKLEKLLKLTNIIPGLIEAWLHLAEIYIEMDNFEEAKNVLRHILSELDEVNSEANLMLARVLIQQKKYQEAESTLELCLSQNLNIRLKALFHFLEGKIHKYKNNFEECINSLERAIACMTDKDRLKPLDLASLYLDLSSSYQITRQNEAAADAIQKATRLLEGTSQEDQVVMARAELEIWKNDANKALTLYSSIAPDSPVYLEARTKMADIYLKHSKDSLKYIECYKELAEENPTQENLIKLAEAYFSIRKISEAIQIYEKAIQRKSSSNLHKKLAEMYCKCHQYEKAIRCYREAGIEGSLDLANLLFRLEQWEATEITLSQVPFQEKVVLMAKIKEKLGDMQTAINILNEAYKKYGRTNNKLAAQLCCQMADYEANLHDFDSAIRHYKLALSHSDDDVNEATAIQISLCKLYLQINDWPACQSICSSLLSKDPNNELALLMSADLLFRKCDFQAANNLFNKLLMQKPRYWLALVRIIEVKRRMGMLKQAMPYLENAVAACNVTDPGLAYCTGLYHWYDNNVEEALKFFNCVRFDPEWGQQALYNMVEIYLANNADNHEKAKQLLQEIRPKSAEEETNRSLLLNFVLLTSKDKQLIEKAMNELTLLASRDVLRVGASLGLATGYALQKQAQRARNVLKIIAKTTWQYEEAEYLERCWVMLAEHYVQSGKHELAHELIRKILTYNAGCAKAHELCGMIAEKDQKYGDVTSHYLKAWSLCNEQDVDLAYRLGMYFLKSKKYADAICTCQTILKKVPNGPSKIKKDVYEKALSLLRT